jgi:hypothetical protein
LPSAENEQPKKLTSSLESNGESGADEEQETGKELEEEENYNDLYITTTTTTTTSSGKSTLRRPPTNSFPRAQGAPAPHSIEQLKQRRGQIAPKAIPHEIRVESGAVEDEQEEKEGQNFNKIQKYSLGLINIFVIMIAVLCLHKE